MSCSFDNLKSQKIWVCWKSIEGRKLPMQVDGTPAKANDSGTWNTYEACTKAKGFSGVGNYITDPWVGCDLDWRKDPGARPFDALTIPEYAKRLIREAGTYTEWSPSGLGVHQWARRPANSPALTIKNHEAGVEVYTGGRYFTYTGRQVPGTGEEITYYNAAIYSPYGRSTPAPAPAGPSVPGLHIGTGASGPIPEGSRNDMLFKKASALRGMGLDEEAVYAALSVINREHCLPPLDDVEVRNIARSVMRYEAGSPEGEAAVLKPEDIPDLEDWYVDDLLLADLPERKCLAGIKGGAAVFTSFSTNQVFAFRGTGKTMFQFALAISLSRGKDFLCYQIPHAMKVLYIEGELPDRQIQERMRSLGASGRNLVIISRDKQLMNGKDIPSLHTERGRAAIDRLIERHQPSVLFLDSMSSLMNLGTNEEDSWLEILPWFTRLRCSGLCIIITQQTGKDQGRGSRGHSRAEDPLDVSIQLTKVDDESEFLHCKLEYTKFRAGSRGVKSLIIKKQEGSDWQWSTATDAIKEQIRDILKKDPRSTNTAIAEQITCRKAVLMKLIAEVKEETAAF